MLNLDTDNNNNDNSNIYVVGLYIITFSIDAMNLVDDLGDSVFHFQMSQELVSGCAYWNYYHFTICKR